MVSAVPWYRYSHCGRRSGIGVRFSRSVSVSSLSLTLVGKCRILNYKFYLDWPQKPTMSTVHPEAKIYFFRF